MLIAYMEPEAAIQQMLHCSHAVILDLVLDNESLLHLTSNYLQIP